RNAGQPCRPVARLCITLPSDRRVQKNLTTTLSSVNVSVSRYWMMLEIGSGPSGPVYIDVKRDGYPLLLVSPRKLQQLYQALGEVPHE
ncbi:hypothetical protein M2646_25985, partial [Klebsiella pneumoniae]|nr:hypothetical protein [Klebsiella pneumoniae]MDZ1849163.1 hypothetical protein [Klebsiella pneumoniae]MDZ1888065.1 hypothetical protein [Klebsiella pneumoniae]